MLFGTTGRRRRPNRRVCLRARSPWWPPASVGIADGRFKPHVQLRYRSKLGTYGTALPCFASWTCISCGGSHLPSPLLPRFPGPPRSRFPLPVPRSRSPAPPSLPLPLTVPLPSCAPSCAPSRAVAHILPTCVPSPIHLSSHSAYYMWHVHARTHARSDVRRQLQRMLRRCLSMRRKGRCM